MDFLIFQFIPTFMMPYIKFNFAYYYFKLKIYRISNNLLIKCFILFNSCFILGCNDKSETISPTINKITSSVYASGFVKSKNQYQVFSKSSGIIDKVFLKQGDRVIPGQAICSIQNDVSKLQQNNASLLAANASMQANEDRLREFELAIDISKKKMENDHALLERQNNLWNQQIGTKVEKEQRELAYESSKTQYESAQLRYNELQKQIKLQAAQSKNNLSIANNQLGDYTIKSEVDGKLYAFLKEQGELISPQIPIAIIGSSDSFYLKLSIDENDIIKIMIGQKVFVSMDSYKGDVYEATITKIFPLMNEKSRSFEAEAVFTKRPANLYPNLTAEANIEIASKEQAMMIPRKYLIDDAYVMISKKEKRKVTVGLKDYQYVEILEGLKKTDKIYYLSK